ncbi:MAG: hypothetical protein ACKOPM_11410 [Novosphingobium sp.]
MATGKFLVALGAAFSLSACNMVVSEKPWFDTPSGPQLKDGLWANLNRADCPLDPAAPIAEWPKCAEPMLIKGNVYSGPPTESDSPADAARLDPAKWQPLQHVLVDGVPQIDQILLSIQSRGGAEGADNTPPKTLYLYIALNPLAQDAEGRITETRRWPILCGPMPAKPKKRNGVPNFTTDRPFKGIRIDGEACVAGDVAALRGAAVQSEVAAGEGGFTFVTSRWIRDGL